MMPEKEALARQIAKRMKRDADETVHVNGVDIPLWRVIEMAMDRVRSPKLRNVLEMKGEHKPDSLKVRIERLFRKLFRRNSEWTHPADGLPPRAAEEGEDSVVSIACLVKWSGGVHHANLLFGTPVGSHRWMVKIHDEINYVHVLEIDGWMAIPK